MRSIFVGALVCVATACASTGVRNFTPESAASEMIVALDEGQSASAAGLFGKVREKDRDRIYPILFNAAEDRYSAGEVDRSVEILRFMSPRFPEAVSVREALLYGLFLERSESVEANAALLEEMEQTLEELREKQSSAPVWYDLVETQVAIDRGKLDDARESFDRFLAGWSGTPARLELYVEDLTRYLTTH